MALLVTITTRLLFVNTTNATATITIHYMCMFYIFINEVDMLLYQKRIDEQKEMISKQAHLAVQSIQEEQQLKSSLKEKDKEIDYLHDIVINLEVRLLMFFS
jgi:septal ring factor EnvC (AmiA/AmiB activator)